MKYLIFSIIGVLFGFLIGMAYKKHSDIEKIKALSREEPNASVGQAIITLVI